MARFLTDHIGLKMSNAGPNDHYNKLLYRLARLQVESDKALRARKELERHQVAMSKMSNELEGTEQVIMRNTADYMGDAVVGDYGPILKGYDSVLQKAGKALSEVHVACDKELRNLQALESDLRLQKGEVMKQLAPCMPKLAIDFGLNPALTEVQYKRLYTKMNSQFYGYNPTVRDYKEYIEGKAFQHGLLGRGGIMHTEMLVPGQPSVRLLFNEEDLPRVTAMVNEIAEELTLEREGDKGNQILLFKITGQNGVDVLDMGIERQNLIEMSFVLEGKTANINDLQKHFYLDAWEVSADTFVNDYKDEYEDGFLSFMKHEGADLEQDEQELSM